MTETWVDGINVCKSIVTWFWLTSASDSWLSSLLAAVPTSLYLLCPYNSSVPLKLLKSIVHCSMEKNTWWKKAVWVRQVCVEMCVAGLGLCSVCVRLSCVGVDVSASCRWRTLHRTPSKRKQKNREGEPSGGGIKGRFPPLFPHAATSQW